MTKHKVHPDYVNASPAMRFSGRKLEELRDILENQARATPDNWAARVLPGGAWVGMVYRSDMQLLELGIHRTAIGEPDQKKRDAELFTFLVSLNCRHWSRLTDKNSRLGAVARFRETKTSNQESFL